MEATGLGTPPCPVPRPVWPLSDRGAPHMGSQEEPAEPAAVWAQDLGQEAGLPTRSSRGLRRPRGSSSTLESGFHALGLIPTLSTFSPSFATRGL